MDVLKSQVFEIQVFVFDFRWKSKSQTYKVGGKNLRCPRHACFQSGLSSHQIWFSSDEGEPS